jgi:virulence factor
MSRISLAMIGYGNMARCTYAPLLHTVADRVTLTGLVEPDPERREAADRIYAWEGLYASVDELLAARKPTAALVLVPAVHHGPVIRQLLEAGVDVYTEKPDTHHLAEARKLVDLARRQGRIYQVGQNRLFLTALARAKELFAATPVDFAHVEKSKPERRTDPAYLLDDGIHVLSPLVWLAGEVAEVLSAVCLPQRLMSAHLRLASGGVANFVMYVDSGHWVERFLLHGPGRSASVVTPDAVELHEDGRHLGSGHVERIPLLFDPASLMGFQGAVHHFLDCVTSRAEPRGSAASLLHVHELMNEILSQAGLETL